MTGERDCSRQTTEVKTGGSVTFQKDGKTVVEASGPIAGELAEKRKQAGAKPVKE